MLETQEAYKELHSQLQTLNWFHPKRITYHTQRFFYTLKPSPQDQTSIWDIIFTKYVFSYCRLFAIFALHYFRAWRSGFTNKENTTRLITLQ